ncbi:Protein of unknown function [Gryllus bimaculatus]|nr:Protein of unknown function [Gryllus bimaculatus]
MRGRRFAPRGAVARHRPRAKKPRRAESSWRGAGGGGGVIRNVHVGELRAAICHGTRDASPGKRITNQFPGFVFAFYSGHLRRRLDSTRPLRTHAVISESSSVTARSRSVWHEWDEIEIRGGAGRDELERSKLRRNLRVEAPSLKTKGDENSGFARQGRRASAAAGWLGWPGAAGATGATGAAAKALARRISNGFGRSPRGSRSERRAAAAAAAGDCPSSRHAPRRAAAHRPAPRGSATARPTAPAPGNARLLCKLLGFPTFC